MKVGDGRRAGAARGGPTSPRTGRDAPSKDPGPDTARESGPVATPGPHTILGIDPGSAATGYGVVRRDSSRVLHVAHGTLRPPAGATLAVRLAHIQRALTEVFELHAPDLAVVERVFVHANPRSALVLGQARGVVLATAATAGVPVAELAPRAVKKAVVGNGGATKHQVQTMVARLLGLAKPASQDASDALALAISRAQAGRLAELADLAPRAARGRKRSRRATTRFVLGQSR